MAAGALREPSRRCSLPAKHVRCLSLEVTDRDDMDCLKAFHAYLPLSHSALSPSSNNPGMGLMTQMSSC